MQTPGRSPSLEAARLAFLAKGAVFRIPSQDSGQDTDNSPADFHTPGYRLVFSLLLRFLPGQGGELRPIQQGDCLLSAYRSADSTTIAP